MNNTQLVIGFELNGRDIARENVKVLQQQLCEIKERLREAEKIFMDIDYVTNVIEGIAVHIHESPNFYDIQTCGDDLNRATARAYRISGQDSFAVRVNCHDSDGRQERWFGGKVLGLGKLWSRNKAIKVAQDWIVSNIVTED